MEIIFKPFPVAGEACLFHYERPSISRSLTSNLNNICTGIRKQIVLTNAISQGMGWRGERENVDGRQ